MRKEPPKTKVEPVVSVRARVWVMGGREGPCVWVASVA